MPEGRCPGGAVVAGRIREWMAWMMRDDRKRMPKGTVCLSAPAVSNDGARFLSFKGYQISDRLSHLLSWQLLPKSYLATHI